MCFHSSQYCSLLACCCLFSHVPINLVLPFALHFSSLVRETVSALLALAHCRPFSSTFLSLFVPS